jgi:hypothetical protein
MHIFPDRGKEALHAGHVGYITVMVVLTKENEPPDVWFQKTAPRRACRTYT